MHSKSQELSQMEEVALKNLLHPQDLNLKANRNYRNNNSCHSGLSHPSSNKLLAQLQVKIFCLEIFNPLENSHHRCRAIMPIQIAVLVLIICLISDCISLKNLFIDIQTVELIKFSSYNEE